MVLIIFLILAALALVWFLVIYNMLVTLKTRIENAWSQIDAQLKRRHDLIPNLVEAVKAYMAYEKDTLERVIKARSQAVQATGMKDKSEAENFLSQALHSLFAVVEKYPDLKANQDVLKLQEELTSTENRISFARQYYNDEAARYNTRIQIVPIVFVARMFAFTDKDFFQMGESLEKEVPKVRP